MPVSGVVSEWLLLSEENGCQKDSNYSDTRRNTAKWKKNHYWCHKGDLFQERDKTKDKISGKDDSPSKKKKNNAVLIFQKGIIVERGEEN